MLAWAITTMMVGSTMWSAATRPDGLPYSVRPGRKHRQRITNSGISLPGLFLGSAAWEITITTTVSTLISSYGSGGFSTELWRNTGAGLEADEVVLPGVVESSAVWGDLTTMAAWTFYSPASKRTPFYGIFRNTGNGFTNIGLALPGPLGFYQNSAAWVTTTTMAVLIFYSHQS